MTSDSALSKTLFQPLQWILTCLLLLVSLTIRADIGIDWIASQSQSDGSYATATDIATVFQATSETLTTFHALGETTQSGIHEAHQFIDDETYQGTEYLSRQIISHLQQGNTVTELVTTLQSNQNQDGGFGELSGYHSTVLDTTFALQALASSGQSTSQSAGLAIGFLQTKQNQAGYFALPSNDASVYITALASQAFQAYQYIYAVSDNITRANDYLLTQIAVDGSAGELFETAVVLTSLAPVIPDQSIYQPLVDYLQTTQQPNGAWSDDVFTTALAIRALHTQQTVTPPQPDQASLSGVVRDGATNSPLINVNVAVTTPDGQTTSATTSADGRYLISNIAPGSASIQFNSNGYYPATATATLIAGQVLTYDTNLLADPTANPIQLSGQVVDVETSLPIANVAIQVLNSAFSAQSDIQGGFEIFNIPAGTVTVEITQDGYLTQLFSISAPAGGAVDLGTISLNPGTVTGTESSISGLMMDAITGEPLRGVLISISGTDNQSIFTTQDGRFLLSNISPGNVVVTASLDGYQNATGNAFLVAGTNLQFNASLVKISNPALVTLQGQVIDAETQQPLTGVSVTTNTGQTTDTDGAGRFYLSGLEPGTIILEFSAVGYNTVSYSINADSGGSINLAAIALAQNLPVTGNNPPNISSIGPIHAAAGQIYEYRPQAIDPESDSLIHGLSGNPSGMDINTTTGIIRWIPTTDQVGEQSYTLVVSDSNGAIAQQTVVVTVTDSGDPSYVITDVETLNALTIDALLPDNYVLGSHVKGGRSGTWRATSPQGCGFSYVGTGTDSASITAAANALDFWSMGSGYGNDGIWDLGEALSTVTVLPLIDHAPFPQEGIEYTIWGSDDPDAIFPDGWTLATLVTIYSQGWADNAAVCGGGVNIDDYAGLYTFGQDKFRYIRLKADNSISIFDTPEHTTYSTQVDNSGLPGWQSVESEIDGVVGMLCDVTPQADAGADILGKTRDSIMFDGTGSQGNIVTYGWDLDGDSEIDLTGASPEHIFTAGFDHDVSLLVVDDKGCVGADTVHVTIGLDYPKPDLIVSAIDSANVATNLQTLAINGSVALTITNQGNAPAILAAEVTLFEDRNLNGQFDPSVDHVLGTQTMPSGLAKDDNLAMNVVVNGISLFRDSPILAMVDSNLQVDEAKEDNNLASAASQCKVDPTVGSFDPVLKWAWSGSSILSSHNQVMSIPIVAPVEDTNNDGVINELDAPGVIFHTYIGRNYRSNGVLRAVSGIDGHELWTVTNSAYRTNPEGSIAVADIDLDGMIEIIAPKNGGGIIVFEHTGEFKWQSTIPQRIFWGGASIADLDNDGSPEIIVGNTVLRNDGTLFWQWSGYLGSSNASVGGLPIVADLNLDGSMEIISGASAYSNTGQLLWRNATIGDGFTAVGNFDADDNPEIVVVSSGRVSLLDHDGTIIWGPVTQPGGGSGGAPTIADMNGDGRPDIGIAGARRYTVFGTEGNILWSKPTSDASSNVTGSSVFDFDGDGNAEVVYSDEYFLRVYKGSDGDVLFATPNTSGTTYELPVIADVDRDNHADIVVCSNGLIGGNINGIRVYQDRNNSWVPTRSIWNQHSYHINNINDDGTVPQFEQPSWLSHNSYRLNTFADRDPSLLADITASVLTIHDNGDNQPASLSVRIGNAGAGDLSSEIGIAFYEGDPANNGTLLGIVPMVGLAPGTYQDIELNNITSLSGLADIYVIADYDNRLQECNEANNRVVLPVLPQTSTGQITVATDQLVYGPNSPVQLQSSVTNTSGVPGEFKATLRVEDAQGILVQSYPIHPIGPLAGGVNSPLTELWETAQYQAGTYILRGELFNLSGEVIHEAISAFEIRHAINGEPLAALRTTTDKPIYNTTDVAQLFNLAQNLAINEIIDDASLQITIIDPSGASVFTETVNAGSLVSGALRDFTSLYTFSQATEGTYTVQGELFNSVGVSLATDQAQFEVEANLQQLLVGEVEVQLPTLDRGQLQICTDTLNNNGSEDLVAQPIRQLLVNLDSGEVVSTHEMPVDLSRNTPYPLVREVITNNLQAGGYACVLQTEIDGEWISLANDTFILTEPPINIEGQLSAGDRGRVLILLDDAPKRCDGFARLGIEATLSTPLAASSTVTTTLYDAVGAFVDQEIGLVDDRLLDQQAGSNGINLIVDDIAPTHIASSVNADVVLGDGYQLVIATDDGAVTETFDSGLIPTNCTETLAIGDIYGDTRLSDVVRLPAANDPLGPNHTPDLATQRTRLETVLTASGWSYTIVTNADDFASELRTGGYVTYLLLSEQIKLDETVQKELREAVYRGEGLIEAGSHDQRQGRIDDALGVKFQGKHPNMQGISIAENAMTTSGDIDFQLNDRTLRATLDGATAIATFIEGGNVTAEPAITTFNYGQGRSLYIGFDLAAESALPDANTLLETVLLDALAYVHPDTVTAYEQGTYPVRLTLDNLGVATPGQVIMTVPESVSVVDAGEAVISGQNLTWPFNLAESDQLTLDAWLKLPAEPVLITALIQSGTTPDWIDQATLSLEITPEARVTVDTVHAQAAVITDKAYKQVKKYLGWAKDDSAAGRWDDALSALLRASDALVKIGTPHSEALRIDVAQAIRTVALNL